MFEQAAEVFFAGDVLRAFLGVETRHQLVFYFEAFEPHDADIFFALFPDLALAQLHGRHNTNQRQTLPYDFYPKDSCR